MKFKQQYKILLEPDAFRDLSSIDFEHESESVIVRLEYQGKQGRDPQTGETCPIYDYRENAFGVIRTRCSIRLLFLQGCREW